MANPIVVASGVRAYTNALGELLDMGMISEGELLNDLLCYLSEQEVEDFVIRNLRLRDDDNECIIRHEDELEQEEETA